MNSSQVIYIERVVIFTTLDFLTWGGKEEMHRLKFLEYEIWSAWWVIKTKKKNEISVDEMEGGKNWEDLSSAEILVDILSWDLSQDPGWDENLA